MFGTSKRDWVKVTDHLWAKVRKKRKEDCVVKVSGLYTYEHIRNGEIIARETGPNKIIYQGLNHIMNNAFDDTVATKALDGTLYVGNIATSSVTFDGTETYATFCGTKVDEDTNYTEGAGSTAFRPMYVCAAANAGVITNSASPAVFEYSGPGATWHGAFLSDFNGKNDAAHVGGILFSAKNFSTPPTLANGDDLNVTIQITFAI